MKDKLYIKMIINGYLPIIFRVLLSLVMFVYVNPSVVYCAEGSDILKISTFLGVSIGCALIIRARKIAYEQQYANNNEQSLNSYYNELINSDIQKLRSNKIFVHHMENVPNKTRDIVSEIKIDGSFAKSMEPVYKANIQNNDVTENISIPVDTNSIIEVVTIPIETVTIPAQIVPIITKIINPLIVAHKNGHITKGFRQMFRVDISSINFNIEECAKIFNEETIVSGLQYFMNRHDEFVDFLPLLSSHGMYILVGCFVAQNLQIWHGVHHIIYCSVICPSYMQLLSDNNVKSLTTLISNSIRILKTNSIPEMTRITLVAAWDVAFDKMPPTIIYDIEFQKMLKCYNKRAVKFQVFD